MVRSLADRTFQPRSLLETGEGKAQLTAEEQAALQIVAAHLVYLDKTEEMVKRTQSMMDEVLQDKRMSITDKIEALHMLAGHLAVLQESAKKTLAGMGLDSDDLLDEAKRVTNLREISSNCQNSDSISTMSAEIRQNFADVAGISQNLRITEIHRISHTLWIFFVDWWKCCRKNPLRLEMYRAFSNLYQLICSLLLVRTTEILHKCIAYHRNSEQSSGLAL